MIVAGRKRVRITPGQSFDEENSGRRSMTPGSSFDGGDQPSYSTDPEPSARNGNVYGNKSKAGLNKQTTIEIE
jgi:hypothetical protein